MSNGSFLPAVYYFELITFLEQLSKIDFTYPNNPISFPGAHKIPNSSITGDTMIK